MRRLLFSLIPLFGGWISPAFGQATDAHKALFDDARTLSRGDKLPEAQP